MDNIVSFQDEKIKKVWSKKSDHKIELHTPLKISFPTEEAPNIENEISGKKPEEPIEVTSFVGKVADFLIKAHRKIKKFVMQLGDTFIKPIRSWYWRVESRKLMGELMTLSLKLNRNNFHVFIRFYGHTENIEVQVYPRGWEREECEKLRLLTGKLPGYGKYYYKMKPHQIREAMKTLVHLSNLNKVQDRFGTNIV